MLCPKCHDQALVIVDRSGIEVDYCGGCRGVWLERGELEKLIDRAASSDRGEPLGHRSSDRGRFGRDMDDDYDDDDDNRRGRRGRRGGFLGEIFDFD